jgi:hypothetical protein
LIEVELGSDARAYGGGRTGCAAELGIGKVVACVVERKKEREASAETPESGSGERGDARERQRLAGR